MACSGCIDNLRDMQKELSSIKTLAKQFAISNRVNVFIYNEEGTLRFISEEAGRSVGIQPTHGVVSFLQPITA